MDAEPKGEGEGLLDAPQQQEEGEPPTAPVEEPQEPPPPPVDVNLFEDVEKTTTLTSITRGRAKVAGRSKRPPTKGLKANQQKIIKEEPPEEATTPTESAVVSPRDITSTESEGGGGEGSSIRFAEPESPSREGGSRVGVGRPGALDLKKVAAARMTLKKTATDQIKSPPPTDSDGDTFLKKVQLKKTPAPEPRGNIVSTPPVGPTNPHRPKPGGSMIHSPSLPVSPPNTALPGPDHRAGRSVSTFNTAQNLEEPSTPTEPGTAPPAPPMGLPPKPKISRLAKPSSFPAPSGGSQTSASTVASIMESPPLPPPPPLPSLRSSNNRPTSENSPIPGGIPVAPPPPVPFKKPPAKAAPPPPPVPPPIAFRGQAASPRAFSEIPTSSSGEVPPPPLPPIMKSRRPPAPSEISGSSRLQSSSGSQIVPLHVSSRSQSEIFVDGLPSPKPAPPPLPPTQGRGSLRPLSTAPPHPPPPTPPTSTGTALGSSNSPRDSVKTQEEMVKGIPLAGKIAVPWELPPWAKDCPKSSFEEEPKFPTLRPNWIPDSSVDNCLICASAFSLFNRRHHCRLCGGIYCNICTKSNYYLKELGYGMSPQRVCNHCVKYYRLKII
eukprot:TRINITY_DN4997_c0_g1_i1.p1 TRINITY_DN4997_c0_g1~~TRINITY_DN4997_c0_g1_i1.p1  ORF type:complete len:657 (-),score=145.60 TRINITY_DN4997_c0_g1_i1:134-1954(-)